MADQESSNFGKRLEDFSSRFERRSRSGAGPTQDRPKSRPVSAVLDDLRDLFTRDVTRQGLSDLLRRDTRETYRFYISNVDFESLRSLPWYQRYPAVVWKVFIALAHRLSPSRRIAFALAGLAFLFGWIQLVLLQTEDYQNHAVFWLTAAFAVILLLLLMELRDKLDLKGDLEVAREIQFGLVPSEPYVRGDFSIHCFMRPANTVGGDYYDIINLEDHRVAIVVGDVSGKGMPAALLMALIQGSLHTLISAGLRGAELMTKLNKYLCATIPSNRLVTLFYGEIDMATGELEYINAGHNAPFLLQRSQEFERLSSTAIVLGVDANASFETNATRICPGDGLMLFTDGITEAFNLRDDEYGEERLAAFLRQHADAPPPVLIKSLVADVLEFCGSIWPGDDMTLMSISRQGQAGACWNGRIMPGTGEEREGRLRLK